MNQIIRTGILGRPRNDGRQPIQRRLVLDNQTHSSRRLSNRLQNRSPSNSPNCSPNHSPNRTRRRDNNQRSNQMTNRTSNRRTQNQTSNQHTSNQSQNDVLLNSEMGSLFNEIAERVERSYETLLDRIQSVEDQLNNQVNLVAENQLNNLINSNESTIDTNNNLNMDSTTNSNNATRYETTSILNREISIPRSNANRIKLKGDKLDGKNFYDWKVTILQQLQQLNLDHLLENEPHSNNNDELSIDKSVMIAIRLSMEYEVRMDIDRHESINTKQLWSAINSTYDSLNSTTESNNLHYVTRYKLQSLKDLETHCRKFALSINQLKHINITFSSDAEVKMFLETLMNHHKDFVLYVKRHIEENKLDLTKSLIYIRKEANVYMGKSQDVSNLTID
jgi:hypothetical protein